MNYQEKIKAGKHLNNKEEGTFLFEIDFIPNGESEVVEVYVYAKNRLEAHNFLILNGIFGEQLAIRSASSNLLH